MTPPDIAALSAKDISWLRMSAMNSGMYPGDRWECAPKRFARLEKLGLVTVYIPHNPVHKERAVITAEGLKALRSIGEP